MTNRKYSIPQFLAYVLAVIVLAFVATWADYTGQPLFLAVASFAWPWLWVGFAAPLVCRSWPPVAVVILGGLMTGLGLVANVCFDMAILPNQAGKETPLMTSVGWMIFGSPIGAATAILGVLARRNGWWSVAGTTVFGACVAYGYYWEYTRNYRRHFEGKPLLENLGDYPQWIWAGALAIINILVLVWIARKGWTRSRKNKTELVDTHTSSALAPATTD